MAAPDPAPFLGYWKITEMEVWALSYIDLVVPGFIEFTLEDEHLIGSFQFGTVRGWMHFPARGQRRADCGMVMGRGP